jgi:hypothetical protein
MSGRKLKSQCKKKNSKPRGDGEGDTKAGSNTRQCVILDRDDMREMIQPRSIMSIFEQIPQSHSYSTSELPFCAYHGRPAMGELYLRTETKDA